MKKYIIAVVLCFFCLQLGVMPVAKAFLFQDSYEDTDFNEFFISIFGEEISRKALKNDYVYVSGSPVGFSLQGDGVVVIAVGEVESQSGRVSPCDGQDVLPGDILLTVDDKRVTCADDIEKYISEEKTDESFEITFLRNKKKLTKHIVPAVDEKNGKARLGLWVRDSVAGIGTLTFVTEKNRFGALGHTVCDVDTGTTMPVFSGKMYSCNIVGVNKGAKGVAGELKGVFVKSHNEIAGVVKNSEFGLYGDFVDEANVCLERFDVAEQNEVHPGKAYILSTVEGTRPEKYDIEIIKVNTQASQKAKSLVFRVTDDSLLNKTGGIVQGMSGSPIIQDNKFVGAVTHVFVSDPTKGYGVYAQWMLEQ